MRYTMKKGFSNVQINMIKELVGLEYTDRALRKFEDICFKYKADPKTVANQLTESFNEFYKEKRSEKPKIN